MKKEWMTPVCEVLRFSVTEEITAAGGLMSLVEEKDGYEFNFGDLT